MVRILFVTAMLALAAPVFALPATAAGMDKAGAAGFADAPAAPAAAPAPKDTPRNEKPMGDTTTYFAKKDFTVETAPRHSMTYFWRQPKKIDSGSTYPLVIVLHDEKGLAPAAQYLLTKELLDAHPSFILVPALPARKIWSFPSEYPDDPALAANLKATQALPEVMDLIGDIQKNFPVDDKRIYIVGCGDGGFGAMGAVYNTAPSTFAAAIAINGGWTQKQTPKLAKAKTPIYMIDGADDKVNNAYLASVVAFDIQKMAPAAMKSKISYLSIPGVGHDCSDTHFYMPQLWTWMYAQKSE